MKFIFLFIFLLKKFFKSGRIVYCQMLLCSQITLNKLLERERCVKNWYFSFWLIMAFSWCLNLFDWQQWDEVLVKLNIFNITSWLPVLMSNFFCLLMFVCLHNYVYNFLIFILLIHYFFNYLFSSLVLSLKIQKSK